MATSTGYALVTDTHDGAQGAAGQFEITVYQNVEDQPLFPIGGSDTVAPTDWTLIPTESNSQRWKSVATFGGAAITESQEVSDITFTGTTAEVVVGAAEAEITQIGITGNTSGDTPTPATVETTEITFAGTSASTAGPDSFSKPSSSVGFSFQQITFGTGGASPGWVGVGGSGKIFTASSADGTWTENTSTPNTTFLNDVAYDGVGRWVAVGNKVSSVTQVWTATDPTGTWVQAGDTNVDAIDNGEHLNGVIHDGTRWLVVGNDALIISAVDPTLDHDDASGDGWITVARDTDLGLTAGRSLKGIAYDGTTNYVAVGDDRNGSEQLFTATDPTGISPATTGGWAVNNTHGFDTDINNVAFANNVWVMTTDFSSNTSFFSNVIVTSDPTSTTAGDWVTTSSGTGSAMNDAAFHDGTWYAVSDATNDTSYMKSTDNGATWTTGNVTGTFTASRIRAAHSADGDLVFASQDGVLIVTAGTVPGSVLTIDGDNTQFTTGAITLNLSGGINGTAMRDEAITFINANTTGLTASVGNNTERLDIVSDAGGAFSNILAGISGGTGGTATATVSSITDGTDENGVTNQQLNFTLTGPTGDPFGSFSDVTPVGLTSGIRGIAFGDGVYVAVGEPESSTVGGVILTSTDGTTWTENASGSPVVNKILSDVTYDGTTWWAVGDTQTVIRATDPTGTWIQDTGTGVTSNPQGITFGNGLLVIAGNGIVTSGDGGTTWNTETESVGFLFGVTFDPDDNVFVVVGNSGEMASSDSSTSGSMTWTTRTSGLTDRLRAVAYDNGLYVAVGSTGKITTTDDITANWVPRASTVTVDIHGTAAGDGNYFAVGDSGTLLHSTDGITWSALTSGTSNSLRVGFFGNSQFVFGATGTSGTRLLIPSGTLTTLTFSGDSNQFTSGDVVVSFTGNSDSESMVSQTVASLEANTTGFNITSLGTQVQVDSPAGATTTTDLTINSGGGTVTSIVRQAGTAGSGVTLGTFSVTAAGIGIHTPSTATGTFAGGTTAAQALVIIRDLFTNGNIGGYTATPSTGAITGDTFLVTSTSAGEEEPNIVFTIANGTNGDLVRTNAVTNEGVDDATDGVADTWTTTINQTVYSGNFGSQANADAQATQQAAQLNAMAGSPATFSAVASTTTTGLLTITATENGNQHNTLAIVTRGTAGVGGDESTADETPTVTTTDGVGDPNWSIPVQDGFRGTTGVDGARGPGRFSNEFIISILSTDVTDPDVAGSRFDTDARAAIVAALGAGANPADGDVATITYQETDNNNTLRTENGLFDLATTSWMGFALTIDGSLLVNGSIVGDKLLAGTVTATQVNLFPQDVGAGVADTGSNSRMVITSDKIEIYEGTTLRVELGDLS